MTKMTAVEVIERLNLQPLPSEGGFYRETYRADCGLVPCRTVGIDTDGFRNVSTAIYFLVSPDNFSALHRVRSDEIFHFYGGDPVEMIQIEEGGRLTRFTLGNDLVGGQVPQIVVRRHVWQALRLVPGGEWALTGTTVAPGFEFADFELGERQSMLEAYPQHREEVLQFTRGEGEKVHR